MPHTAESQPGNEEPAVIRTESDWRLEPVDLPDNMRSYRSWRTIPRNPDPNMVDQTEADTAELVNPTRLREERLVKLQTAMHDRGFAALLLTSPDTIRYACGTPDVFSKIGKNPGQTYAVVFGSGMPILFERVGPDAEIVEMFCPWLNDRVHPALVFANAGAAYERQIARWTAQLVACLRDGGASSERVGVDTLGFAAYESLKASGVRLESAGPVITNATLTKTRDERELLRQAARLSDNCFHSARHEWVIPGARERDIAARIMQFYVSRGAHSTGAVVATGSNTNPLFRNYTNKLIERGDMCIIDIGFVTYQGYGCDYTRCWPVAAEFNPSQKEAYRRAYSSLQAAMSVIRPGATSADIAKNLPLDAEDVYQTASTLQAAHSVGLGGIDGFMVTRGWSLDHPEPILQDMCLAVETYCALPDGAAARLEELLLVTEDAYEVVSRFPFEPDAFV